MKPKQKSEDDLIVICNTNIHKSAKLTRTEFLDKVKSVREIRCREVNNFASFYITNVDEFYNLKKLYDLINQGDFPKIRSDQYLFAIAINPKIYEWFKSTSYYIIERQIIFWMASVYFFSPDKRISVFNKQFYPPIIEEIKKIINIYYSTIVPLKESWEEEVISTYDLDKSKFIFDPIKLYFEASDKFLGMEPPEFLSNPFGMSTSSHEWGIDNFNFTFINAYFTERDWSDIVLKDDSDDSLIRSESRKELWYKWKHTFSMFEFSKNHIYSFYLFGDSDYEKKLKSQNGIKAKNAGFIYLMRNPIFEKNIFKIGLTRRKVEKRAKDLSNTSVPDQFYILSEWFVDDCVIAENRIKEALKKYIVDPKREFFRINHKEAIKIIQEELDKLKNEDYCA